MKTKLEALTAKAERQRALEARAREKAERHERKLAEVRERLGLEPSAGPARARAQPARPSGVGAIRLLFSEHHGRVWSAAELYAELSRRGWISAAAAHPLQGVEAALSRLVRAGELQRVSRGRYASPAVEIPRLREVPAVSAPDRWIA